ncbi:hypothetical protein [Blastococcus capsensis]|uniref:hypothetical protein n=1 Tax=Blastococcus capsensis TaxID=1564163 RepID=UPI0025405C22|nr:hypothetical protein [Blastococcus capsensis]MDK3255061.1 hypothetical protein [Blastococcus capsensis]
MGTSATVNPADPSGDAPLTLAEPPPQTLGLRDAAGLWGDLGISLLLPVAAVFVVLPGRLVAAVPTLAVLLPGVVRRRREAGTA